MAGDKRAPQRRNMTHVRSEPHSPEAAATSVVVVAICSIAQLRASLVAIDNQSMRHGCEVIVAADPRLGSLDDLRGEFPSTVFLSKTGCDTPVQLTAMALENARGQLIVLTEDSCVADDHWLAALSSGQRPDFAAVGGGVEAIPGIGAAMWAFCFVDFFRYMKPLAQGRSPSLSVCNVAYYRSHLLAIEDHWRDGFHESEVHGALQERFGALSLIAKAEVRVQRNVAFGDAIYERYAFGRLFGATRIARSTARRRLLLALLSPLLPLLLMARMSSKALANGELARRFVVALPAIVVLVVAWSWGEWLGYVTARRPARITTAPELDGIDGVPTKPVSAEKVR